MIKQPVWLGVSGFGILLGILFALSWHQQSQLTFPVELGLFPDQQVLGQTTYTATGAAQRKKLGLVYGFLPYWNVNNYQIHPVVSHLAYFRLAVNGKGEIITQAGDGGYQIYQGEKIQDVLSQVNRSNIQLELTFFTSQSEEIKALIQCSSCQDLLVENIATIIERDHLDGINIDFEYLGTITESERASFTDFMYKLSNMLDSRFPRTKLSIDVYGGAANSNNIWDFPKLAKMVDRVIVMGYDYKTRRSIVPGPTAPTLGKGILGGDIWEDIRSMMRYIPSQNIILAVPFYGYAWETTSGELDEAQTYTGSGETLTYLGARNLLADEQLQVEERWDERSLTPYLVWKTEADTPEESDSRWHIGFFENPRSLGYKIDLVETLNLGGIAIWALGYEGDYQELWTAISERF
jgi:spore germination protein YaaH